MSGLHDHPEWYAGSGLTYDSDPRLAQAWLHHLGADGGDCELPCGDLGAFQVRQTPCRPRGWADFSFLCSSPSP